MFLCNVAMGTHCLFAVTVRQTITLVSFVFYPEEKHVIVWLKHNQ